MSTETLSTLLDRLLELGTISDHDTRQLRQLAQANRFELSLRTCAGYSIETSIARRLQVFNAASAAVRERGLKVAPSVLWSEYIPLADLLFAWSGSKRPCLFGIAGPPGVGKSFLTAVLFIVAGILSDTPAAVVSLDDFYLEPAERHRLGYQWRAVPGTHDLNLLSAFLEAVKSEQAEIRLPRYDTRLEKRLPPLLSVRPQVIFFEGWLVGAALPGYEALTESLDHLIYLDMDLELARQCRLDREAKIRSESNNTAGMTTGDTERFWREALLPNIGEWLTPLKSQADLTLTFDSRHRICGVSCAQDRM